MNELSAADGFPSVPCARPTIAEYHPSRRPTREYEAGMARAPACRPANGPAAEINSAVRAFALPGRPGGPWLRKPWATSSPARPARTQPETLPPTPPQPADRHRQPANGRVSELEPVPSPGRTARNTG